MSKLTDRIQNDFSKKVYPDLKDPAVLLKLKEGMEVLRIRYLGMRYSWMLNGDALMPSFKEHPEAFFTTHRPFDKSIVAYFPKYDPVLMDLETRLPKIREAGRKFFETTTWQTRVKLLETISQVAQERFWLLCAAKGCESGQNRAEQIGETDEEVDFPLVNAWYLERLNSEEMSLVPSPAFAGNYSGKRFVPHGVFLNICPFNFPGAIPIDMATKALALGNAIIEKSSPKSALSGYLVWETMKIAFERMGIDWRGVINYAPGGADVVDAMLASKEVAGVSFTGSTHVLSDIRRNHGTLLRRGYSGTKAPLVYGSVETSGVNPLVVCEDADPEYAASEYVRAVVGRQGQKCSSARIAFVHDSHFDKFLGVMKNRLDSLRYGDVTDGADIGAMASQADVDKLLKGINYAVGDGMFSSVLYTKSDCRGNGYDFPPTILLAKHDALVCPNRSHKIMNTEYFGPVSTIIRYGRLSDVKTLLALSEFALTGSIFTDGTNVLSELIDILPAGNVYVNRKCTGALVETECFGGLRSRSGLGIKGFMSLALFGSQQTISGFYPKPVTAGEQVASILDILDMLKSKGFVLSKS